MPPVRRLAALFALVLPAACGGAPRASATPDSPPGSAAAPATATPDAPHAATPPAGDAGKPAAVGSYRIILERPWVVGTLFERSVVVTDSSSELLMDGAKKVRESEHRVQLALVAKEEVLEVDARGNWTYDKLVVQRFTAAGAKGDEPIVPPGTVLTIRRAPHGGEPTYTSSAGELSKDAKRALGLAVPAADKTIGDDDVFGSTVPRAPGDSWDVARDVAARDLQTRGVITDGSRIQGNMRLVATVEDRGAPCLELTARMMVPISGFAGLPPGTKIEAGALTFEGTTIAPVAPGQLVHRSSSRVALELKAEVPGKGKLTLHTMNVRETTYDGR